MADGDTVAVWNVPMSDKMYKIEFEHGTTSGKRVVRVNGKVTTLFLISYFFGGKKHPISDSFAITF